MQQHKNFHAGDDRALCALGWHHGTSQDGRGFFFRFGSRLRDGTLIYRFGPAPFDRVCRTFWAFGKDARAWTCDFCGNVIDAHGAGGESAH